MREKIPTTVEKDLETVRKYARVLVVISPDNSSFEFIERDDFRLEILVIIGPAKRDKYFFEQAILAEVGLSRARPYNSAKGKDRTRCDTRKRTKIFGLTEQQYLLIASRVFNFIFKDAKEKGKKWKTGTRRSFKTEALYWKKGRRSPFKYEKNISMPLGIRYAFSMMDPFFIQDIYWAELNNEEQRDGFRRLARSISKRLSSYYQLRIWEDSSRELREIWDVARMLVNYPMYKKAEILKSLPGGTENFFYKELIKFFGLDGYQTREHKMLEEAQKMGDPQRRLGELQIRIIKPNGGRKNRHYIVIEVHPPWEPEIQEDFEGYEDDIPF